MKAFPKDYETLFMFSEHTPFSCEAEASDFKSECPPDKKVKKEDLFKFKRGRGDLHVSVVTFGLAAFFLAFFWTETGWNTRKLPDEFGLYLAHQFGLVDLEGRGMRFGRILKQSWFAPMLCVLILVPTTIWNLRASWQVHRWRKRFLQPTGIGYELEKYAAALEFVGYFIGYTVLVPILGYLVSTLALGSYLTWRLGYRTRRWGCISMLSSFAIVLLFRTFLQIKTPGNIWLYDQLPGTLRSYMLTYF